MPSASWPGLSLANRAATRFGVGRAIVVSAALGFPAEVFLAVAMPSIAIACLIAFGLLGGFATAIYNINQVSFRQAITPERMQGRMNATMRFIVWGTLPIGSVLGGLAGRHDRAARDDVGRGDRGILPVPVRALLAGPVDRLDARTDRGRRGSARPVVLEHRHADPAFAGGLDGVFVAGVHVAEDAHRGIGRQDTFQFLGSERRAVGDDDHPGVL